ncbi:MAG: 3-isopropylmalate dehydratase [Symbiobacteriaceae bacterium]|nr:3-isopropylmalate dehydratase [Symbiobacteriaceae bacterium]
MNELTFTGTAFSFGDNINTDYLISSRRKRDSINPEELKSYIMEDIRPTFFTELGGEAAIIVAGSNFGCGSAMEVAAQILVVNHIQVVLAKSFARSFFRNCINNGVLPLIADTDGIKEGDALQVALSSREIKLTNVSRRTTQSYPPLGGTVQEILAAGGLVAYMHRSVT